MKKSLISLFMITSMKKPLLYLLIIALFGFTVPAYGEEEAPQTFRVDAKAALLMEPVTGRILVEQNAHEKLAPASITKIMTMLLIYEAVDQHRIKWDDMVTVSQHAASMGGSQIYLEAYEQQTVRDLTKAIAVASANDASVAMAEFIAGSEEGFVVMMNKRSADLGMVDTVFKNACGLDEPGHISSAADVAIMSRELITKYPDVHNLTTIWMDTITHKTARGEELFGLSNTNRLIKNYSGATGLKTGSTSEALYCISATAKRDNLNLIAVVMGAPDPNTRFLEAMKMLDYGFANYAVSLGEAAGTNKGSIKVLKGSREEVGIAVKKQIGCLISKGKNNKLDSKVELLDSLTAPVTAGAKAGEIIYFFEGKEVGRSDLVAEEGIDKASLSDIMGRLLKGWFSS